MVNGSTGKCSFEVVYTKLPNFPFDFSSIVIFKSQLASKNVEEVLKMVEDV